MKKSEYEDLVIQAIDDDTVALELFRKGNKIGTIKHIATEGVYREKVFEEYTLFEDTYNEKNENDEKIKVFVLQFGTGLEIEFDDCKLIHVKA